MDDLDECTCGHMLDEHDPDTLECQVDDCWCIYFEEDLDA